MNFITFTLIKVEQLLTFMFQYLLLRNLEMVDVDYVIAVWG